MHSNSRPVTSNQAGNHDQLSMIVARHAQTTFQKPITDYNREAFHRSMEAWQNAGEKPLILDAGCGVGLSTYHLAQHFPDHFVLGVDQSADRLMRNTAWPSALPDNVFRVRADLVDFWRMMLAHAVHPQRHYVLYPNPWPKASQLGRRWHGHAVFPTILALGGQLECRSNWRIYIDEFASAVQQLSGIDTRCEMYVPNMPITPFEKKYLASGQTLWRCRTNIAPQLGSDC